MLDEDPHNLPLINLYRDVALALSVRRVALLPESSTAGGGKVGVGGGDGSAIGSQRTPAEAGSSASVPGRPRLSRLPIQYGASLTTDASDRRRIRAEAVAAASVRSPASSRPRGTGRSLSKYESFRACSQGECKSVWLRHGLDEPARVSERDLELLVADLWHGYQHSEHGAQLTRAFRAVDTENRGLLGLGDFFHMLRALSIVFEDWVNLALMKSDASINARQLVAMCGEGSICDLCMEDLELTKVFTRLAGGRRVCSYERVCVHITRMHHLTAFGDTADCRLQQSVAGWSFEDLAASKLQASWRGYTTRTTLHHGRVAMHRIVCIQARWRGIRSRATVGERVRSEISRIKDSQAAATRDARAALNRIRRFRVVKYCMVRESFDLTSKHIFDLPVGTEIYVLDARSTRDGKLRMQFLTEGLGMDLPENQVAWLTASSSKWVFVEAITHLSTRLLPIVEQSRRDARAALRTSRAYRVVRECMVRERYEVDSKHICNLHVGTEIHVLDAHCTADGRLRMLFSMENFDLPLPGYQVGWLTATSKKFIFVQVIEELTELGVSTMVASVADQLSIHRKSQQFRESIVKPSLRVPVAGHYCCFFNSFITPHVAQTLLKPTHSRSPVALLARRKNDEMAGGIQSKQPAASFSTAAAYKGMDIQKPVGADSTSLRQKRRPSCEEGQAPQHDNTRANYKRSIIWSVPATASELFYRAPRRTCREYALRRVHIGDPRRRLW